MPDSPSVRAFRNAFPILAQRITLSDWQTCLQGNPLLESPLTLDQINVPFAEGLGHYTWKEILQTTSTG